MWRTSVSTAALLCLALLAFGCGGKTTPIDTCDDGLKNQYETDVDCGGACHACDAGRTCIVDADCRSRNCLDGVCQPEAGESCDDSIKNQDETDVDCGGSCPPCPQGGACLIDDDCQTGFCEDGVCTVSQEDLCPDDPDKTSPGVCGCGTPDTDSDGDLVADCIDGCPDDADKIEAGQCGCGAADTDSDGDAVADCNDACPNDAGKIEAGQCGCGAADTDSDGDAVADCLDGCPNDADKLTAGQCGCGLADTDTDSDGTADCNDACPDDPDKVVPGTCGCGTPDTDTDSDATPDCTDQCINDPNKIAPGVCGCGVADTDTDSDGTPNCHDPCPDDPDKLAPGTCGCGFPDTDTDSDGTPDCLDRCPVDPAKTVPGQCGCGIPETDSDGDGSPDCVDACPDDPDDDCLDCHPMGWDGCPTGATEWCYGAPVDGTDSAQARVACETCLGAPCQLRSGDCAGDGWSIVDPAINPDDVTFGFEGGCSGPQGRIWDYGTSWTTFGFWAGMPAAIDADALTFSDAASLEQTRMTIAEAGGSLWGSSGGGSSGLRLAQYDTDGALMATFSPAIDLRSVFTRARGTSPLLARGYGSNQIQTQTSPGVFGNDVALAGGTLDAQSAVVYDHVRDMFVALTNGVIYRWNDAGTFVDSIPLIGWDVDNPGESAYPQGRGMAVSHSGHYLTYHNRILSVWDQAGQRIYTTVLTGAGTSFDSYFSFSYTGPAFRGYVYLLDDAAGAWRRWIIGL